MPAGFVYTTHGQQIATGPGDTPPPPDDRLTDTLAFGCTDTLGGPGLRFLDPWFGARNAGSPATRMKATRAGVLDRLFVEAVTGPLVQGVVFTLYVNGVATALTCTLGVGATSAQDVTHSVAIAVGDLLTMACQKVAAGGAGAMDVEATMRFSGV